MEPPPAPISTMSMTGTRMGSPLPLRKRYSRATSKERLVCGTPPSIRQILAVVPPMSKDSTESRPQRRARSLAKMAPPAGPDSARRMGKRTAVSRVVMPPPESIMKRGQAKPMSSSVRSRSVR